MKKIVWFNKDDGFIERAKTIASIISVAFAVFVYFHTIHPVFVKEKELLDSKQRIIQLNNEIAEKTTKLKLLEESVVIKSAEVDKLSKTVKQKNDEVAVLEKKIQSEISKVKEVQNKYEEASNEAIQAYLFGQMREIADYAMRENINYDLGITKDRFKLQQYCFELVKEKMNSVKVGSYEYQAINILNQFAKTELTPESYDGSAMFDLITYKANKDYEEVMKKYQKSKQ